MNQLGDTIFHVTCIFIDSNNNVLILRPGYLCSEQDEIILATNYTLNKIFEC